jgi:hypothetical protein
MDTGSKLNLIRPQLLSQINYKPLNKPLPVIQTISMQNIKPSAGIISTLIYDNKTIDIEIFVLPGIEPLFLLGWPTIKQLGLGLRMEETDSDEISKNPVSSAQTQQVLPHTCQFINVNATVPSGVYYVEKNVETEFRTGLLFPNSMNRFEQNSSCTNVLNYTSETITLYRGTVVGHIQPIQEEGKIIEIQPNSEIDARALIEESKITEEQGEKFSVYHNNATWGWDYMQHSQTPYITTDPIEFQINQKLTDIQTKQVEKLLIQNIDCFAGSMNQMTVTDILECSLNTGDSLPIKQLPYRTSITEREEIDKIVFELLESQHVVPSNSPWSAPVVLVSKADGSKRLCVDYRQLNKVLKPDSYPLPHIDDLLASFQGSNYFSTLDFKSGYFAIKIREEDQEKTAFVTPRGVYQFRVLPFGISVAPSVYQRLINCVFASRGWRHTLAYLDDLIIFTKTFAEHLEELQAVFNLIRKAKLKLNPKKCTFFEQRVKYLGYIVSKEGISTDPNKIRAVQEYPRPTNLREVRSYLGFCSYYRRFIKDFSRIVKPLTGLTKKNAPFNWNEEQEQAFNELKICLSTAPVLGHPDLSLPFQLRTDVSKLGIGAILIQEEKDGRKTVLGYASRALSDAEACYSSCEMECLGVIFALSYFRSFLVGKKFTVVTDNLPLKYLLTTRNLRGRLARWALLTQEFTFDIVHRAGVNMKDADALSRAPIDPAPEESSVWMVNTAVTSVESIENSDDLIIQDLPTIQEAQESDKELKLIRDAIRQGKIEKYRRFTLSDDILYFSPSKKREKKKYHMRVYIPASLRKPLLYEQHDDILGGHQGFRRTFERMKSKYYFPKMLKYVYEYCRTCKSCQKRGGSQGIQNDGLLGETKTPVRPWQLVSMDHIGPFSRSARGNKYILTCTDHFSRYTEYAAVPDTSSYHIKKFLLDRILYRWGAPEYILTDRGTGFMSENIREVYAFLQCKHLRTSGYNPRANGMSEGVNRGLAKALCLYSDSANKFWDIDLVAIQYALNTSINDTTKKSSFEILHGYTPVTVVDNQLGVVSKRQKEEDWERIKMDTVRRTRLQKLKTKARFDKNRKNTHYQTGDKVLVYKPTIGGRKPKKMIAQYHGPYKILRKTGVNTYEIKIGRKYLIINQARIKKFYSRKADTQDIEPIDRNLLRRKIRAGQREFTRVDELPSEQNIVQDSSPENGNQTQNESGIGEEYYITKRGRKIRPPIKY